MKNPILLISIVAILVVIALGAFSLSRKQTEPSAMMEKTEIPTPEAMEKPTGDAMVQKTVDTSMDGAIADVRYVEYSKSALDMGAVGRRVLFFYASWCPTCKPADASFTQNTSKIPDDLTLIRVNYNDPETDQEEKDLANKYGITYQHTYVQIDSSGKEVTKWNGGQIDELLSNIK